MKYIGIDFGEKRVGIAISDEDGKIAFPALVLENNNKLLQNIFSFCQENDIKNVILGESKNYKGQSNLIMKKINSFKLELESLRLKVFWEPEFMTSIQASRITGENKMLDASAAALILQSYLDRTFKNN